MPIMKKPAIAPVHNPVFETWASLEDVIHESQNELPHMTPNRLRTLFGIYHNSLIKLIADQNH